MARHAYSVGKGALTHSLTHMVISGSSSICHTRDRSPFQRSRTIVMGLSDCVRYGNRDEPSACEDVLKKSSCGKESSSRRNR